MIELITTFLAGNRFALVGASRNPKHFSRLVMADYSRHGYEILPVNPNLTELDGKPCWKTVGDIAPLPETAMIAVPATALESVVRESIDAGLKMIWIVRGVGDAEARKAAAELCRAKGVSVIDGPCPLMYLNETTFPHRVHGWIWKLVGMWGK